MIFLIVGVGLGIGVLVRRLNHGDELLGHVSLRTRGYECLAAVGNYVNECVGLTVFGLGYRVEGTFALSELDSLPSRVDLDLYGKDVTVEFYRYAREERKFSSLDELRETVEGDIKRAKEFFDKIST
jgi:FAD synthase